MNKFPFAPLRCYQYAPLLPFALGLLWLMLLAGCRRQNEINPTSIVFTPAQTTPIAHNSPTVFLTVTRPSATNEPTVTASLPSSSTPTVTETPTVVQPTATKTILPTPTATLTMEKWRETWLLAEHRIEAVMASNNGCQLPCWWGIKPGDSVSDARQVFDTINETGWIDSPTQWGELQQVGFFHHFYVDQMGNDIGAGLSIKCLVQEDLIKVFEIYVNRSLSSPPGTPGYNQISERLIRDWEQFSAENMFATFGEPDLIYLLPQSFADGNNYFYEFNLYYRFLGIVVSYSSPLFDKENDKRSMCLNLFDMDSVRLILYDPTFKLPSGYLQATYSLWPLDAQLTEDSLIKDSDLESRTGLSIDEFVEYVGYSNSDCFSVQ